MSTFSITTHVHANGEGGEMLGWLACWLAWLACWLGLAATHPLSHSHTLSLNPKNKQTDTEEKQMRAGGATLPTGEGNQNRLNLFGNSQAAVKWHGRRHRTLDQTDPLWMAKVRLPPHTGIPICVGDEQFIHAAEYVLMLAFHMQGKRDNTVAQLTNPRRQ